jgi:AcrR family transcriptional regulator
MTERESNSEARRQKAEQAAPGRESAKEQAFGAAVRILALKGCQSLTLADVAREAKLAPALVKRLYPDTTAIYVAIIERYTARYYESTLVDRQPGRSPEEHVGIVVRQMVNFIRANVELAIAADAVSNQDIPQLHAQSIRAAAKYRSALNDYFRYIGLDISDPARMAVARGFLTIHMLAHFQARYIWENRLKESARKLAKVEKRLLREPEVKYDDAFYARYAEMMTQMYLRGINGLAKADQARAEEEPDSTFWLRGLV